MFANDSASPPSPITELSRLYIDHEDIPMQQLIYAHEMTQDFKALLAADTSWSFDQDAPTYVKELNRYLIYNEMQEIKFWRYSQRGDLKQLAPLIADKLNTRKKEHTTCKAPTFSLLDLGK
ncbi:hypothetical protein B484DRAFT_396017 [Ochromonadaceae sp. CCMP2298]|nr:hypothetical protein B484DRAFT_396017 [Ochromonadaceae sp. CCMP2298]